MRLIDSLRAAVTCVAAGVLVSTPLLAGAITQSRSESRSLIAHAFELAHNLDQDEALAVAHQAIAADPEDPAAYRSVAAMLWLKILFRRGVVTFDDYLGDVSGPTVPTAAAPPELAVTFHTHVDRAVRLAEARLKAVPTDVAARYELGAGLGLVASYSGTVQGNVLQALRAARRAFNEHERVLELAPRRKDAGLIVGMYRYGVSDLALPLRMMAYVAGFGGGRERGIRLIEEAATYRDELHTDPLFPLFIIYNRERRYADATRVLNELQRLYPRNRLLWLNAGSTALAAGFVAEAERVLTEGLARLERDPRPRAYGEEAVWKYKRGAARVALGQREAAEDDLRAALAGEARDWVRGRAHVERGKLADLAGERARARKEYAAAIELGQKDHDAAGVAEARRLLRRPFSRAGIHEQ